MQRTIGIILAMTALAATARAETGLDNLDVDAGGTFFGGLGGFVSDDGTPGQAAWRREGGSVPVYTLARLSATDHLDDDSDLSLFLRVKPWESPGVRTDVLPDSNETMKDAYLRWKSGSIGELRVGYQADVRANEAYYAPQVCNCIDGFFGSNTPELTFAHGPIPENSTAADFDSRAPKLAYYSPGFYGFRVALSYAPEQSMGRPVDGQLDQLGQQYVTPNGVRTGDLRDDQLDQFWSAAAEWSGTEDEFGLGAAAGVSGAKQDNRLLVPGRNDQSPLVWDVGISGSYAAWKLGAAYEQQNFIDLEGVYGASAYQPLPGIGPGAGSAALFMVPATNDIVTRTFDLGVSYTIGPATVAVSWSRGYYEGLVDTADTKIGATNDVVFGGGQFQFDEHVALLAGVEFNRYDPDSGGHALPRTAALDLVYGGSDPTLNVFDKPYSGVALVLGVAVRF